MIQEAGGVFTGRKRRGGTMIFFALALAGLMAVLSLTVDYGHLLVVRWKLQTAVDAAALAAGRALVSPAGQGVTLQWKAEADALAIATRNVTANYAVNFLSLSECEVTGNLSIPLYLGSFIGLNEAPVSARAVSQVTGVYSAAGIRPFGVEEEESGYVFGQLYDLKMGEPDPTAGGNFHALSIEGTGADVYRHNIMYGSSDTLSVGDWIPAEPGNMVGPTDDGIEYIMQLEVIEEGVDYILEQDQIAWEWYMDHVDALEASPRLITVPVVGDWSGTYGRSDVQIIAFARFFLDGTVGTGKDCRVTGRFVEAIVPGAVGGGDGGYGAYAVRLVQ